MLCTRLRASIAHTSRHVKRNNYSGARAAQGSTQEKPNDLPLYTPNEDDARLLSPDVDQSYKKLETEDDWFRFQLARSETKTLIELFTNYGSTQTKKTTFQASHALHKPRTPTLSALLASGAHFGHSRSLLNQNFMPYAYGERSGITIIDLDHTIPLLRRAANLVRSVARSNGNIVFIGTRPDLRPVVRKAAERLGVQGFHVGERWVPGTLTNRLQVFDVHVVQTTRITPDLVIVLNPLANMNAIYECAISHVPTIAIVDSNVDPRIVMYPIPANDESTRTAEIVAGVLSVAGREGMALRKEEETKKLEKEKRFDGHGVGPSYYDRRPATTSY